MQVPTMQKHTVEEMREKYEKRYFSIIDKATAVFGINGESLDSHCKELANLFDEIAVDGYCVETITANAAPSLRGLHFRELSDDTWRKVLEEKRKREQTARQEPILYANEDDK